MSPELILSLALWVLLLTLIAVSLYLACKPPTAAEKRDAARRKNLDKDEVDEEEIQSTAW